MVSTTPVVRGNFHCAFQPWNRLGLYAAAVNIGRFLDYAKLSELQIHRVVAMPHTISLCLALTQCSQEMFTERELYGTNSV